MVSAQRQDVHLQKHKNKTFCNLPYFLAIAAISGSSQHASKTNFPFLKWGKQLRGKLLRH